MGIARCVVVVVDGPPKWERKSNVKIIRQHKCT